MLDHKERWILFYGQQLKATPDDPKVPDILMENVMRLLFPRQQNGDSVKIIRNETAAIRITDMQFDDENKTVCLLLQYADKTVSDPVFSNLETGALRVEPKLAGEGVAISSHMLISLEPNISNRNEYLTLLEDVPGIGRTKIEPFITSELKMVFSDQFKDSNSKTRRYRPIVEMEGHMAQSLQDGLKTGYIQGVDLVRYGKKADFDEPTYTTDISYSVKINCVKSSGNVAMQFLARLKEKAKAQDYSEMRVRYKRKEGKQQTVPVSTAREDALDAVFSKMELIKVDESLPQCSPKIRADVLLKMTSLLLDTRKQKK